MDTYRVRGVGIWKLLALLEDKRGKRESELATEKMVHELPLALLVDSALVRHDGFSAVPGFTLQAARSTCNTSLNIATTSNQSTERG